jgi:hypothetical protein
MHDEASEQLVQCVPSFNLHGHGNKECHKEHDTACKSYDLLSGEANFVLGELDDVSTVGEKAHDSGNGAAYHDDQVEEKDDVEDLVAATNLRPPPLAELKSLVSVELEVAQFTLRWLLFPSTL